MIQVNPHIAKLKPSVTLAINERVKSLRKVGAEIYHFGFGQSPFPVPTVISEGLKEHRDKAGYLPSLGLSELRLAISQFLKKEQHAEFDAEGVLIGPGSKELLFQTLLLLDGITLIPMGSWVSYLPQVIAKGGSCEIIETQKKSAYKLSPESLKAHCKKHDKIQKTLILNSPNNPTGAVYSDDELKQLAVVCRKHDVIVLSDEIYSLINFNKNFSPSMSRHYPEKTIVFSGLSKIFSAGGYRLGFIAIPKTMYELLPLYQAIFSETFSAVATPVQFAAVRAFQMPKLLLEEIQRNRNILRAVSTFVRNELKEADIDSTPSEGGFYTIIDLSAYSHIFKNLNLPDSEAIAYYLLDNAGIALLPGSDFYFPPNLPVFRLAYVDFDGSRWSQIPSELVTSDSAHIRKYAPNVFNGIKHLKATLTS